MSTKDPIATRFVLVNTSHAGNVGAVARAMKVMSFSDLVLVNPRWSNVLRRQETIARASGANDVLASTRIVGTLEAALEGMSHVCATGMTARDFGPPTRTPREHFSHFVQTTFSGQQHQQGDPVPQVEQHTGVAFVFGGERYGLSNEDVYKAHVALRIPVNPQFGSLNLAAAVQVIAYEWRMALDGALEAFNLLDSGREGGEAPHWPKTDASTALADAQQIQGALLHWQEALTQLGYLDLEQPKKLMPRLNQLLNRADIKASEIHILRGVAKAILQRCTRAGG